MDNEEILNRLALHGMSREQVDRVAEVRGASIRLGQLLNNVLPEGREKSLAITHLEEVLMWSSKAISREDG